MNIPNPDCFYVVIRDDDLRLYRHPYVPNVGTANGEAMRLAQENPGHKFYILKVARMAYKEIPKPVPPDVMLSDVPLVLKVGS